MKTLVTLLILLMYCGAGMGQPDNSLSPFSFLHQFDNPAAMGLDGKNHLYLGTYQKWLKLNDAPKTYWLASSHPIISRSFGVGGIFMYDQAGLLTTTKIGFNGSVHLNPDSDHKFSVGGTVRYVNLGFGSPNVDDPIINGEPAAGTISLGAGVNYHFVMKDGQFLNFQVFSSNLLGNLDVTPDNLENPLIYNLPQALTVQGNLKLALSDNAYLTPSLRYQRQLGEAIGAEKQIIDLGLGFSFLDETISTRIGYRTADAGIIYGGVGYRFGEASSAHVFFEPGGPLGSSAAFVGDLAFGEMANKDVNGKKKVPGRKRTKNRNTRNANCYKSEPCIQEKLLLNTGEKAFTLTRSEDKNLKSTYLKINFKDNEDVVQNYFKYPDFIQQVPLNALIDNLSSFSKQELSQANLNIAHITLKATVKEELSGKAFDNFVGETIAIPYLTGNSIEKVASIPKGKDIDQLELALIKLHYLQEEIKKRFPNQAIFFRKEVSSNPKQVDARSIDLIITIR